MTLRILDPGLFTLVVDLGRPGSRSLGVPVGGAADRSSLALGNALVGNPPASAALEISLAGPTVQAGCALGCVVFGAPFDLSCGQRRLRPGATFNLAPGEVLRIGGTPSGMRAYLCIRGGIDTSSILGSRSAFEPLKPGADLACVPGQVAIRFIQGSDEGPPALRILPGAQADWFDLGRFAAQDYVVTPASNRMGLRLKGKPVPLPARELVSEPVCPGAVQVTRDGQCIILGVDGQTIGGYPKIAQVVSADLDKLGQLRPGAAVAFEPVSLEEAEELFRRKSAELHEWLMRLQVTELAAIDMRSRDENDRRNSK